MKPRKIDAVAAAFGAADVRDLLPPWDSIPDEFKGYRNPTVQTVERWFFDGGRLACKAKPWIDEKLARIHLGSVMRSFEPRHEHKVAGVAYLISLWFDEFEIAGTPPKGDHRG